MTIGIALGLALIILIAVGVGLSRRQSATKKAAIADLQREKEAIGSISLRALAEEEATDLGLPDVEGATDIPLVVLLKVWKAHEDVRDRCPSPELLEFVLASGVPPAEATEADVSLRCTGADGNGDDAHSSDTIEPEGDTDHEPDA